MTASERDKRIKELFEEDLKLLQKKGHDYSGDEDALSNFRDFGWYGVLVRIGDKWSRLRNLSKKGKALVEEETMRDTLRDLRNYCYLLEVLLIEEEKNE